MSRPWGWERLRPGEGATGWEGWMASLTRWTWVWASSGRRWRTGTPEVLQSSGHKGLGMTWRLNNNERLSGFHGWVRSGGETPPGVWWAEPREAAQHPPTRGTDPAPGNSLAQSVSSAQAANPGVRHAKVRLTSNTLCDWEVHRHFSGQVLVGVFFLFYRWVHWG